MDIFVNKRWAVVGSPFKKIEITLTSSSRGSRTIFLPLYGKLEKDQFCVKTNAAGGYIIGSEPDTTPRCLYLGHAKDGFRGSSGLHSENKAIVLASDWHRSACDGESAFAVIIEEGKPLVYYERGRRHDQIFVVSYENSELVTTVYSPKEFDIFNNAEEGGGEIV